MKKVLIILGFLLSHGIFSACSSDANNEVRDDPFVGEWHIVSIEDGDIVTDYPGDIKTVNFYEDGRFTFSPLVEKIGDEVVETYATSEKMYHISYSFTEQELSLNLNYGERTDIFKYTFSDDNNTLKILRIKVNDSVIHVQERKDPYKGITFILEKSSKNK